jgi:hypothetical protein
MLKRIPQVNKKITTPPSDGGEIDQIISNLLEDHIDMYNQDRDSSAALGADIETAKAALLIWHQKELAEARQQAKMETARDFTSVVQAFNHALSVGFDKDSIRTLRMVLNGADARANYVDLPVQIPLASHPTNTDKERK